MKLRHVQQVVVAYEATPDQRRRVGRLALKDRQILFEYDPEFVKAGLELSPIKLPLLAGVSVGPDVFGGLHGLFDDSLPDGWGKLLIDRRAAELGLSSGELSPLDRLTLVGARSMGALTYEPEVGLDDPTIVKLSELARETEAVLTGTDGADLERLIALGGSPKGARPKVLVQIAPNGDVHFGSKGTHAGFTAWLVKFRSPSDHPASAVLEHAYFEMAKAAGIDAPRTQLLGASRRSVGYIAIQRFDRDGDRRVHMHTLGGLLHLPYGYSAFDYESLLKLTRGLTHDESAVAEMFRCACFNVFAHNRDDHSRNFAFLMDESGTWRPSPAYDLTFSSGPGGQHTMLVAGEGSAPTAEHLRALAKASDVRRSEDIISEVRAVIARFPEFADAAGVPARLKAEVMKALGLSKRGLAPVKRARTKSRNGR